MRLSPSGNWIDLYWQIFDKLLATSAGTTEIFTQTVKNVISTRLKLWSEQVMASFILKTPLFRPDELGKVSQSCVFSQLRTSLS